MKCNKTKEMLEDVLTCATSGNNTLITVVGHTSQYAHALKTLLCEMMVRKGVPFKNESWNSLSVFGTEVRFKSSYYFYSVSFLTDDGLIFEDHYSGTEREKRGLEMAKRKLTLIKEPRQPREKKQKEPEIVTHCDQCGEKLFHSCARTVGSYVVAMGDKIKGTSKRTGDSYELHFFCSDNCKEEHAREAG